MPKPICTLTSQLFNYIVRYCHLVWIVSFYRIHVTYQWYVLCLVTQSCLTLCDPMDSSPPGSSVHGDSPCKNTGVGCHALLQGNLPNSGIKPRSPTLQADSLTSEPSGKPMNIGVGSLSLLQGTFSTLELNQGLLHCRWILYQPSYRRSPAELVSVSKNDRKAD